LIESFGASGDIKGTEFPKLLIYLNDIQFEGQAHFKYEDITRTLFVKRGVIAYGISNDFKESLDEVLVKYGIITEDQLKTAIEEAKLSNKSLAKYLIETQAVGSEDLIRASALQVREIVTSLIILDSYNYFLKKDTLPKNAPNLEIHSFQIIFDSILSIENIEWVHNILGSPKNIYKLNDEFVSRYKEITYTEEIDLITTKINGKHSVENIIRNSNMEQNQIKTTIAALLLLDMAEKPESDGIETQVSPPLLETETQTIKPKEEEMTTPEVTNPLFEETPLSEELNDFLDNNAEIENIPEPVSDTVQDIPSSPGSPVPFETPPVPPLPDLGSANVLEELPVSPHESSDPDLPVPSAVPPPPPISATGEPSIVPTVNMQKPGGPQEQKIDSDRPQMPSQPSRPIQYVTDDSTESKTDIYLQMLDRQRNRRRKQRKLTLILAFIFLALAGAYFTVLEEGAVISRLLNSDDASKNTMKEIEPAKRTSNNLIEKQNKHNTIKPLTTTKKVTPNNRTTAPIRNQNETKNNSNFSAIRSSVKSFMKQSRFVDAANQWKSQIKTMDGYTISIEVACSPVSVITYFPV